MEDWSRASSLLREISGKVHGYWFVGWLLSGAAPILVRTAGRPECAYS